MYKTNTTLGWVLISVGIVGIFVPFVPGILLIGAGLGKLEEGKQRKIIQRKRKKRK